MPAIRKFRSRNSRMVLVGGIPQTPEIITCGDGCASRWNAEIFIHEDRKRKNLIIAIVKRHGGLDFLKLPSVKCNRSVGKELLSNVFLFHRQVDTIGY